VESWEIRREGELGPEDHGRLAAMLRASFPTYVAAFPDRRSWSGARPEARVVAYDDSGVAAHAGILRRFIQVVGPQAATEQVVGVVGLVAVRPDLQGTGVGRQLGVHITGALRELAVPFGLLGCRAEVIGFYKSVGWHELPPTRSVYCPLDVDDSSRTIEDGENWMVLPVLEDLGHWPAGDLLWNGSLV
jgi:nodulation protein A